jgi:hypothetical protein
MLRAICGDTKFYQALADDQNSFKGKSANTDSLRNKFNAVLGVDLSEFFRDFVGGSGNGAISVGGVGYPIYDISWNTPASNTLVLKIASQTQSIPCNVSYFNDPVALRAVAPGKDTTIILYDWGNGNISNAGNGISTPVPNNLMSYRLSFTPTILFYDDSARTLSDGGTAADGQLVGYVWNGSVDNDWANPGNWASCCGVPPNDADITIATTLNTPVLPGAVTIRHLTINAGKTLNIGANTLTINGNIDGTGTFTGSNSSHLILKGNAGILYFNQASSLSRSLNSLEIKDGCSASLGTDLEVSLLRINPAANFSVLTPAILITK